MYVLQPWLCFGHPSRSHHHMMMFYLLLIVNCFGESNLKGYASIKLKSIISLTTQLKVECLVHADHIQYPC